MRPTVFLAAFATLFAAALSARGADFSFRAEEIETELTVGYAVSVADVNGDDKPDIVVTDSARVVWYENPGWKRHTLLQGKTKPDNVSLAAFDITGDGQLDFALGADWRPADTVGSGSLQWFERDESDSPAVHSIGQEPTVHRIRSADFDGDGRDELIVVPLFGRGTSGPHFQERAVRILSYTIPEDPKQGPWKPEVINEELHVAHNFWPTDLNHDGKLDLLVASFEGVSLLERSDDGTWSRRLVGEGNQQTSPSRGASEVKHGRLADGDYIATIEPWHGFQAVVYLPNPEQPQGLWKRQVLDDKLAWGHAVWCANLDDDEDQELIIGVRDEAEGIQRGVRIYDPSDDGKTWTRHDVDPNGVAVEDLTAADLDGDGKMEIIAAGRQTHNVRIYWPSPK